MVTFFQKEAHKVDLAISSTEPDHIADFLATVQMANKEFEVEHPEHHQMKIIDTTGKTSLSIFTFGPIYFFSRRGFFGNNSSNERNPSGYFDPSPTPVG